MQVVDSLDGVETAAWNRLAAGQAGLQPFLRHEYLSALERTGCVGSDTGWLPRHLLITDTANQLVAAAPLYEKYHSYGEYVFDWAWADAYQRHGLPYYPKLLSAVPFTPVPGRRLLASGPAARDALVAGLLQLARAGKHSSLHLLFAPPDEIDALQAAGLMVRRGVQFHWHNRAFSSFEQFLDSLSQPKRKKIRAERRKVREAGVQVQRIAGADIDLLTWQFFIRCYDNTYAEHQSTPYLNLAFFLELGRTMPENLLMVVARRDGRPIAASLIMMDNERMYGRYWGALEFVPCLHFELAYYQSIEAAIELNRQVIEGGAQGEHKMARGFTAVPTASAHWLAEPAFAEAVDRFLAREGRMIDGYLDELRERDPFRQRDNNGPG